MHLPGYTAEASLAPSGRRYRALFARSGSGGEGRVIPQQGCPPEAATFCMPILTTCAYNWCWWNIGLLWGRGTCLTCMDACIDAHTWMDPTGGTLSRMCKGCARSWPCP